MKIRNGFVSNSSSSSFVIVFNPNYNMKGKKKIDEFGDSPFDKIIEMYGQKEAICNSAEDMIKSWCENNGLEREQVDELYSDKISKIEAIQDQIPKSWKWAEIAHPEGTVSRISSIIASMSDLDLAEDSLDLYDFNNGYMIIIHKE